MGALKRLILERAVVASVDLRNFTSIGLGRDTSGLYLLNRMQSLIEFALI